MNQDQSAQDQGDMAKQDNRNKSKNKSGQGKQQRPEEPKKNESEKTEAKGTESTTTSSKVSVEIARCKQAVSPLQVANSRFRLENHLRNKVLDLADELEAIDDAFKESLFRSLYALNPAIGDMIYRSFENSVGQNPIFSTLLPSETMMLQKIMQDLNVCRTFDRGYDIRMDHQQLLQAVINQQGSENGRDILIGTVLNRIFSLPQQNAHLLESIKADLARKRGNLEIDEFANSKRAAIQRTAMAILAQKKVWNEAEASSPLEFPPIDIERSEETLRISARLGTEWSSENVKVDISESGQRIIISGEGENGFVKSIDLPATTKPSQINAEFSEQGILEIVCPITSTSVPLKN
ncbi:hypothetical protein HK103_004753 [Boothiomyces macroporosus]|uniref:SHSP domain-containing protein n=1 Tax=Boothiomyces macroporosus TaxID=261099 RepID=A0AAD5UPN2_9FUNG|nr:hypothetical protein HK103_004753 [Boothiomyces macroporosus]